MAQPHRRFPGTGPGRLVLLTSIGSLCLAGACNRRQDVGPVVVSVVGAPPRLADPGKARLEGASRLLIDATAQGLVRFDATARIEPGLAERWTVIDDGMSYIFRLREAEWSNGKPVTAADVVTILRRQLAPGSRNALAPYLTAIDEVVEMTPQVIEIRLKRPRPDLLNLFAQPELAIFRLNPPGGTGPFRIVSETRQGTLLRPAFDPARIGSDDVKEPAPEDNVMLIGERASRAIVRFLDRESDMVTGGTYLDWPVVTTVQIAPANLRGDQAAGLFGLAVTSRQGFLSTPENRAAIAQAIDRPALVAAFAPQWQPVEQVLPDQLDSARPASMPAWATLSNEDRRRGARSRVDRWRAEHDGPVTIRIALPKGPGSNILFGFVGAALKSIGLDPQRVDWRDQADLRLVDAVAPYDSARWYLANACAPCADNVEEMLIAARDANSMSERAAYIADADAALTTDSAFIPIARPLRWSIVSLRLRAWQGNPRAVHPLNRLRSDTR